LTEERKAELRAIIQRASDLDTIKYLKRDFEAPTVSGLSFVAIGETFGGGSTSNVVAQRFQDPGSGALWKFHR